MHTCALNNSPVRSKDVLVLFAYRVLSGMEISIIKTRPSYLYNGHLYNVKTTSLFRDTTPPTTIDFISDIRFIVRPRGHITAATSSLHVCQNDVATSFWRDHDVVIISPVSEGSGDVMVLRRSRPPPATRRPPPATRRPPPATRRPQWC